ncbi:MAG: TRAP transporter fused permease subunit [Deltaproteobacteria bacterium]|nr:TRAP transporter fused permease subunit [Deltaproteobacteria bacterium]MBW1813386.1 TRAP transporter fused permease subunit [Deltaproteobacteria bacterium]MBW1847106.1 TRAP transporter fused permease subunit [Deltaproteobacteria bacterium]MBW1984190.1 TRAP transporter fused permease subunit [Deltaproteobacteria bacterium]MBW2364059.1 TRAP transporter fused permease subunit [Deltaproteobacteria bacterium]
MKEKSKHFSNIINTPLAFLIPLIALLMIAYHISIVWHPVFGELMNQNTHLGFCLVLLFITWAHSSEKIWMKILYIAAVFLSLALVIYMAVHYERLDLFAGFPNPMDIAVGVALIVIVMVCTWKSFGSIFPSLVLVAIAYALWGHHIKGVLGHPAFKFGFIVSNLSVGFQGIYGMLLSVSANILFLLVIFGSIFEATGVTRFFTEFGALLGKYLKGGAGHTAVFSSSFVGMVNGAAVANVAITGSYTIPVMKKAGFKGETAGAIEAMASTGGQLTPPIMGIAVFVMAAFLGVSYTDLMFKAIIPAVAFYTIAVLGVIIIAFREKIPMSKRELNKRILIMGAPVFIVPMTVLTALLMLHYSAGYAAFWGIIALLTVSLLLKDNRPKLAVLKQNLVSGAQMAATFGAAVGCIGMLIKSLTFTGAATKLSLVIAMVAGGKLLPVLILTMLLSILLSSSTPTVIAYIVVAFVAAPILTDMGLNLVVAHFFVFYYAILAAVTPPVAGAAMVGSQIAGASYLKTSWESFKLVGPFYLLPFFLIRNPVLFMEAQPLVPAVMALLALVVAMGTMMFFCQGYCLARLSRPELAGFFAAALLATWYGLFGAVVGFISSIVLTTAILLFHWRKSRAAT